MISNREVTELFIDMVEKRKCLYGFKDRVLREKAWQEVAEEMGETDVNLIKMKWKNLKDSYIKFRRANFLNARNVKQYKNWTWGQRLSFLAPFVKTKRKMQDINMRKRKMKKIIHINLRKHVKEEIIQLPDADLADTLADTENIVQENSKEDKSPQDQNLEFLKILQEPEIQAFVEKPERLVEQAVQTDQIDLIDDNTENKSSARSSPETVTQNRDDDNVDNEREYSYKRDQEDDVYYLFRSYSETFRRFSPRRRIMLKLDLAKLFLKAEMDQLEETHHFSFIQNPSNSHDCVQNDNDDSFQ